MTAAWIRRLTLAVAALTAVGVSTPAALAGTADSRGTQYYVDCAGGSDAASGLGATQAWKTLAKVNSVVFAPGSRIVFKRGTRCAGTFAPKGSGTPDRPITTGGYGTGAKPGIDAGGALAAVLLHNVEGWELRDLDLTDQGPPPGESELRIGVYVLLEDFGIAHHIVVSGVDVHDVNGCDCRNPHTPTVSGGIVFKAGGTTTPSGFDDIAVERNTLKHVDRQGIATSSDWERRAQYPDGRGTTYVALTRVRIAGNYGEDIGGDAVGVYNATNAVVEGNVFRGWAERAPSYTAALSAFNSDGTVFRYNEVSYGHGSGPLPSAAFMTEHANLDTVFEHNFSHENQGGMLVVCADAGRPTDRTTIRYNISDNDFSNGYYPDFSGGTSPVGVITVICLETGHMQVYGNTIHAPNAERMLMNYTTNALEFTDNIFVGRAGGSQFSDPYGVYDHNLYQNIIGVPAGDTHAVIGDPRFAAPGRDYRLRTGSPALSAGAPNGGVRDFFGYPVPRVNPSIGAYTGPGVR